MLKKIKPVIYIVLPIVILVLIRTFRTDRFSREAEKPIELSAGKSNIINPANISSLEGPKLIINMGSRSEIAGIKDIDQVKMQPQSVLDRESLKLLNANSNRKVLLWSEDAGVTARTWMLLSQMDYRNVFILLDTRDNEVFKSEFRPDSTSAAGILKE